MDRGCVAEAMPALGDSVEILFFADAFVQKCAGDVRVPGDMFDRFAGFEKKPVNHPSGSLWLRKT